MKLTEVLLADKNSPPSRVDPPAGNESIVMRALRHLLDKNERIIKRVKLGDGKTKAYYLTHVIINNGPRSPRLIFTDSRGQQSIINIVDHMDDLWTLVPDEKLKGRWNMTRIDASHAVSEMRHDTPMMFELLKQRLEAGDHVYVKFNTTVNNSPMVAATDGGRYQERGVMMYPWQVEFRGQAQGRPTVALSYFHDSGDAAADHDTIYLYADVMDERFELVKEPKYDAEADKPYTWYMINRRGK